MIGSCSKKTENEIGEIKRAKLGESKKTGGCWGGKQKTNVIKLIRFVGSTALVR